MEQTIFSVAVAAFLLLRMEKRLADLTDAINRLRHCATCIYGPLETFAYNQETPAHSKAVMETADEVHAEVF